MTKKLKLEIEQLIKDLKLKCSVKEFRNKMPSVDWYYTSIHRKLSESFIEKYKNKVSWIAVSAYQKLSEKFIEKHEDKVDWHHISSYQKLSEDFIEKYKHSVAWSMISKHQHLSENFIEKYENKVEWYYISKYQKVSNNFRKKYNMHTPVGNWLYASIQKKLDYIKENTNYEIYRDFGGYYLKLYKSVRNNYYSIFNFQYKYEVGKTYESMCDCNLTVKNSFGLSSWTKEDALDYFADGRLLLVKVYIKDIGAIVHYYNKVRSFKLTVLEEVSK